MRRLIVLAQNAGPSEPKAGHKLAFEFAKQAAKTGNLDVALLINDSDVVDNGAWKDIGAEVVYLERFNRFKKVFAIIMHALRIPPRFCTRMSAKAYHKISDVVAKTGYDEVIFEFSQALPYVDAVQSNKNVTTYASLHDVQLQVVLRAGIVERMLFTGMTYRYEKELINKFDVIYTLCNKDRDILKGLFLNSNVVVRPPAIDDRFSQLMRDPKTIEKGSMLFWGALDRKENEEAVKSFITKIFPLIAEKVPHAKLYVVGNNPPKSLTRLSNESIVFTGFVDEPFAYFEKSQIGIVPLLRGAGVKIKTLEMLSAGLPVVATEIGAEGIEKNRNLTVVNMDSFAKEVVARLCDVQDVK
jgi:glycosyltransferase involved in cell wall biosynthesis